MKFVYQEDTLKHVIHAIENDKIIGDFCIYKGVPYTMTISIEDEFQKKGISRIMMRNMIEHVTLDDSKLLFIDVDASVGFWDHIGMRINRYGLDYKGKRNIEGRGYEKVISWKKLKKFAL